MDKSKTCTKCKVTKLANLDYFPGHKKTKDGLSSWCRLCNVAYTQQWKSKNVDRERINRRNNQLKIYGIDQATYTQMLKDQDGKCKICKTETSGNPRCNNFYVDHCHKTGEVRGLLCHNCNYGLGYFKDNIETLQKAIEYLG